MNAFFSMITVATTFLLSQALFASASPITVQSIVANGDGCPDGTASITLSPDQRSFSVLFDQALVQTSNSLEIENKTCELTIVSNVPAGWKFNMHATDYRGFSQVDPGSITFQRTSYYRLTSKDKWALFKRSKKEFSSDFNDNYIVSHGFKLEQPQKQRCTDHLETIKIQVQLVARSKPHRTTSAQLALDSVDGTVEGIKEVCISH